MRRAAQHRAIAQKVEAEGWAGGISFHWLLRLSQIKKSWCNGICRFAVLRWALNQDDDVWLSLRGTRHNQPCQLCGKSTDIYPKGFWHFPICESCIRSQEITPASLHPDSPVLVDLYRTEARTTTNIQQESAHIVHSCFQNGSAEGEVRIPTDEDIRSALRTHLQQTIYPLMTVFVEPVEQVTTRLDIGVDGALYPLLLHVTFSEFLSFQVA